MLLYVKVRPNQRFDRVGKQEAQGHNPRWTLSIKAPATDGKANRYLVEYLGELLGIPPSSITLKRGAEARIKCLDIPAEETFVLARLEQACH